MAGRNLKAERLYAELTQKYSVTIGWKTSLRGGGVHVWLRTGLREEAAVWSFC